MPIPAPARWRDGLRDVHRPVRGIRVHEARSGRCVRAGARLRSGRRLPHAAAAQSDGRCHGARDPAGRGCRLSRGGIVAAGHDDRRPRGRCHGRGSVRTRRAVHGVEGGCLARGVLSAVAGARRDPGVAARLERRSAAYSVRHGARARQCYALSACGHHQQSRSSRSPRSIVRSFWNVWTRAFCVRCRMPARPCISFFWRLS